MITVTHDQEPAWSPAEKCCFCKVATRYWYTPKDVAVCQACALAHTADEVPTKRAWINSNRAPGKPLLPDDWRCNAELMMTANQDPPSTPVTVNVPVAVLDLLRFMCETWAKTDEWARQNGDVDAIGSYPVIQGTGNQIRLLRISHQPYDHRNLLPALDWMQQFNEKVSTPIAPSGDKK